MQPDAGNIAKQALHGAGEGLWTSTRGAHEALRKETQVLMAQRRVALRHCRPPLQILD
jgi:hypothetical protein